MDFDGNQERARQLISAINELRRRARELEETHQADVQVVAADYQASARNLLHYLAVRQTDIRPLQAELILLGLTSLGNIETAVMSTLNTVLYNLHMLAGEPYTPDDYAVPVDYKGGRATLERHTQDLLGEPIGQRRVRIMVTMPSEAAGDKQLIHDLLAAGMDAMRINCAHDGPEAWLAMIDNLRQAEQALGRSCRVYADLAGPKLRTGPIKPVGRIVRYRPERNHRGEVVEMCHIWLTPVAAPESAPQEVDIMLPIEDSILQLAKVGDELWLTDTRGRHREMQVIYQSGCSCLAATDRTHYAESGMTIRLMRKNKLVARSRIGPLPELVLPIPLAIGDKLVLTRADIPGEPAVFGDTGAVVRQAQISCTLKEAFDAVKPGHRILFDDGKIQGCVVESDGEKITVEITHTSLKGGKLQAEKGINFPDTTLMMPSMTAKDLQDLEFMVNHVDVIGLSFVRTPEDVIALEEQLRRLNALKVGVVLKIEIRQAFENLPRLLLTTMRTPPDGVMVARGDLAAEVGFERMAEVQEEILWFCEAAHIPVIWATQVLESLAKQGAPSRAEVTDAVMSGSAECVMLNKGPYIVEAVQFLGGVLERMEEHRVKRRTLLRKLSISQVS